MISLRTITFRIVAAAVGLGIAVGLGEAAIRILHLYSDTRFVAPHPRYGIHNVPGAEGWYVKGEVRQYVTINGRGLHDRDQWSKGGGVLLLGDSFIAAFQVPLEASCQEVNERLLSQALRRPVEVTAAACNGWGTVNQMAFLLDEGFTYDPAAVVVALFPENDLMDNMGPPPSPCQWPPAHREAPLLFPGFLRQAIAASSLLQEVTERLPRVSHVLTPGTVRAERALVRGLFHLWHREPTDIQDRMWARLTGLLCAMKDSVAAHHAAFGVLLVPGRLTIYPEEVERLVRQKPMLRAADLDPVRLRTRLIAFLDSLGVPCLDLAPEFRMSASRGVDPLFPREGHWTAEGNMLAAEGLCRFVVERGLMNAAER